MSAQLIPKGGNRVATETLCDCFQVTAARCGNRPAVEIDGAVFTYAEFLEAVESLAARLEASYDCRSARFALLASKSVGAYVGYLAGLRSGATVVPLNPYTTEARNVSITLAAKPVAVITDGIAWHAIAE